MLQSIQFTHTSKEHVTTERFAVRKLVNMGFIHEKQLPANSVVVTGKKDHKGSTLMRVLFNENGNPFELDSLENGECSYMLKSLSYLFPIGSLSSMYLTIRS